MNTDADVVIIGAGIAGVSTAFHLSARLDVHRIVIVDPRPPLTLTSDKSTECYRNWWPNTSMVGLMNRSIDLLEEMASETGNSFNLKRPGYLYVTADPTTFEEMGQQAEAASGYGAGQVRTEMECSRDTGDTCSDDDNVSVCVHRLSFRGGRELFLRWLWG